MANTVTCTTFGNRGRLGNQLFQASAVLAYADRTGRKAVFRDWYCSREQFRFTDYFANPLPYAPIVHINSQYQEPTFHYIEIPNLFGDVDLFGYFQSERYFEHCPGLIRHYFTPSKEALQTIRNRWERELASKTCSIHVRRTDYLNTPQLYPVSNIDYYRAAMEVMKQEHGINKFIVFGDDIVWMKANFKGSEFLFAQKQTSIADLFLMSMCTHNIITNSSFSWWASWLNQNPEKIIIAPKQWVYGLDQKDIYRKEWIVI